MSDSPPGNPGVSRAVILMTAGCALLTVNDSIMKSLTAGYPAGETIFVRGLFVAIPIALLVHRGGGLQTLRVTNLRGQLLRAALLACSMFLFVTSLRFLPLADAVALTFAGPLILTAVAPWALGERVGWRRRCAVAVGFAGVLIMLAPGGEGMRWAAFLPLGTAFFEAARDIVTRRLVATESSLSLTACSLGFVTLCALATAGHGWRPMSAGDVGLLAMAGCLRERRVRPHDRGVPARGGVARRPVPLLERPVGGAHRSDRVRRPAVPGHARGGGTGGGKRTLHPPP